MNSSLAGIVGIWFFLMMGGCKAANTNVVKMANPATVKCINDGWLYEPIFKNSVPIDGECINTNTGQRCPEWQYFRGECKLTGDDQKMPPPVKH